RAQALGASLCHALHFDEGVGELAEQALAPQLDAAEGEVGVRALQLKPPRLDSSVLSRELDAARGSQLNTAMRSQDVEIRVGAEGQRGRLRVVADQQSAIAVVHFDALPDQLGSGAIGGA